MDDESTILRLGNAPSQRHRLHKHKWPLAQASYSGHPQIDSQTMNPGDPGFMVQLSKALMRQLLVL